MEAVIFIGIQAVGKSTFYKERFFSTHVRINLDMLKTRQRESLMLQACLVAKQPFVVDNTNILKSERASYIELARAAGFQVQGYYFQSRLQDALQRNSQRSGKAKIPEKGVIATHRHLEVPTLVEGFNRLFYVQIDPLSSQFVVKERQNEI
ncbi:MAG: AAA family ATPase [Chloroflexi bacterium]|jgi:predicted kinase|nr:AAA family ATPase [Chloroflexota bacterium]